MAEDLLEMLKEDVVLSDGGMILEARWRGYDTPRAIVEHPDAIRQIHRDFYNAGSQVLEAVTWFCSRSQLERNFGWGDRLDEVNRMGVQLAVEASDGEAPVGGCLVSTQDRVVGGRSDFRSGRSVVARPGAGGVGGADCDPGGCGRGFSDSGNVPPAGRGAGVSGELQEGGRSDDGVDGRWKQDAGRRISGGVRSHSG